MASIVEEIVDLPVSREKLLGASHRSKFLRLSFSPSYWNMGAFRSVVLSSANILKMFQSQKFECCTVQTKSVSYNSCWSYALVS